MTDENVTGEELTIESVTAVDPTELDDNQRTFLTDHADELDDEVASKYGVEKSYAPTVPEAKAGEEPEKKKEDDDDFLDEDTKISRKVQELVAPIKQQTVQQQNQFEVDEFIRGEGSKIPNASRFRDAMVTVMKTPGFERLKAEQAFHIVAGKELMRLGAAKERAAASKARGTQTHSSAGGRPSGGAKKDYSSMSSDEFKAEQNRVLGRQGS